MEQTLVSVIVPIHQAEKTLARCVRSILRQSYRRLEILLVENGSTDRSFSVCTALAKRDGRIKAVHLDAGNVSQARNWGLRHAQGGYLCFVDADDYLDSAFVETLADAVSRENASMSVVDYLVDAAPRPGLPSAASAAERVVFSREQAQNFLFREDGYKGFVWNKLFLASLVREEPPVRFQTEIGYCEDLLFVFQYLQKAGTVVYTRKPLYHYSMNPGGAVFAGSLEKRATALDAYERILGILDRSRAPAYSYALAGRTEICRGLFVEIMRAGRRDRALCERARRAFLQGMSSVLRLKEGISLRTRLLTLLAFGAPHLHFYLMKIHEGRRNKRDCPSETS